MWTVGSCGGVADELVDTKAIMDVLLIPYFWLTLLFICVKWQ